MYCLMFSVIPSQYTHSQAQNRVFSSPKWPTSRSSSNSHCWGVGIMSLWVLKINQSSNRQFIQVVPEWVDTLWDSFCSIWPSLENLVFELAKYWISLCCYSYRFKLRSCNWVSDVMWWTGMTSILFLSSGSGSNGLTQLGTSAMTLSLPFRHVSSTSYFATLTGKHWHWGVTAEIDFFHNNISGLWSVCTLLLLSTYGDVVFPNLTLYWGALSQCWSDLPLVV